MSDAPFAAGSVPADFRSGLVYDVLTRLPLVAWFAVCGWAMGQRLLADLAVAPSVDAAVVLDTLARASAIAFVLLVIMVLCVRRPAVARAPGLIPRIAAFGGTFSITTLALFAPVPHSAVVSVASLLLMLGGYAFACYAVLHLGRSLSIMAEARKLVTTGPYRFVRHPLYAAEAVASVGLLLQYLSPGAIALWLAHIALQFCRMHYEESVLRQSFREYDGYAGRVARIIPGIL
jgi:protein-S-isoprenylcysteine O-methyltransferase Ste14